MILSLRPTVVENGLGANEYYSVPGELRSPARQAKSITAEFAEKCRGGHREAMLGIALRLPRGFAFAGQLRAAVAT
jgi:hypothetical protein